MALSVTRSSGGTNFATIPESLAPDYPPSVTNGGTWTTGADITGTMKGYILSAKLAILKWDLD